MADIQMCIDHLCPMKFECYRYTAPWNQFRQFVFTESPRDMDSMYWCKELLDNRGRTLDPKFREYEKPEPSPKAYKNNIKS